jgi:hypothetical protein
MQCRDRAYGLKCPGILLIGIALCVLAGIWLSDPAHASLQDFVEYWAAGRANLDRENPYDAAVVYRHERAVSPELTAAIMMWNPPWTLTIVMPFALLPARLGFVLWLGLHLVVILVCADGLWRNYGGADRLRGVAWLVAIGFVPTFFALRMGQITPLVLAGVVGFLWAERSGREWTAGAWLALVMIKPHLIYLFVAAVLFWAVVNGRWRIGAGFAAALSALAAVSLLFNPDVLQQYREALTHQPPQMLSPTIGALLRLAFGIDKLWLQYVPVTIGLLWFGLYWRRARANWMWRQQAPVLLFASLLTTSYGAWPFDLVILLVPVIQATVWLTESSAPVLFGLMVLIGFNVLALATMNVHWAEQYWHVWMAPLLLCGYVMLRRQCEEARAMRGEDSAGWVGLTSCSAGDG